MARKTRPTSGKRRARRPASPPAPPRLAPAHAESSAAPPDDGLEIAHLPVDRESFVGRDQELLELQRLSDEGIRLVTLLGPAGVGKTRLVRRYATVRAAAEPAATFCDLSDAETAADVLAAVARPLGVPLGEAEIERAATQLGHAIAARGPLLVLLDNFEQVVDYAASTVGRWLGQAPQARFLVTSRAALGLAGEARLELPPLPEEEALRLLQERASPLLADTAARPGRRETLTRIVRLLDHNPLAIELAAPRLGLLTPDELLQRLSQPLSVLRTGRRDVPARHTSLERAIGGSWKLLAPWEQTVFAWSSVFRGGFTVEAAEAIVGAARPTDATPVLDALQTLRDQSLLRARATDAGSPHRLTLDETVRAFAAARLDESGARPDAEARHASYYVDLAEACAAHTTGPHFADALAQLAAEADNLLAIARASGDAGLAARATLGLEPLLATRGPLQTLVDLLERVSVGPDDPALGARVLRARGAVRSVRGRIVEARADLAAALALARQAMRSDLEAQALYGLAQADIEAGRLHEAHQAFEEAAEVARRAGDRRTLAKVLGKLGELDQEEEPFARALALVRALGDQRAEVILLGNLGRLRRNQGRLDAAREVLFRALDLTRELGGQSTEAWLRHVMAMTDHVRGELDAAAAGYRRALEQARSMGHVRFVALSLLYLGALLHERESPLEAQELVREALELLPSVGDPGIEGLALGFLGAIDASQGNLDRARQRFADARRLVERVPSSELWASVDLLEAGIDAAASQAAQTEGDAHSASRHRRAATERLDALMAEWASAKEGGDAGAILRGTTVAIAARMLERALQRADAVGTTRRPAAATAAAALQVERSGAWFVPPHGDKVDLSTRHPFRRLLVRLTEARLEVPGRPATTEELIATAWPGERILPRAGANRLYNAIAEIRRLGLGTALYTRSGGYLLDPRLDVRWAD